MALVIAHEGNENTSEDSLFQLVNGLPDALAPFFKLLYRFGALWALGLVVVAALVARRWRLARDMAIAGCAAWFLAPAHRRDRRRQLQHHERHRLRAAASTRRRRSRSCGSRSSSR